MDKSDHASRAIAGKAADGKVVVPGEDTRDSARRWLAQDVAPTRHAVVGRSIYSWKGYQHWADRVRQSWKPES